MEAGCGTVWIVRIPSESMLANANQRPTWSTGLSKDSNLRCKRDQGSVMAISEHRQEAQSWREDMLSYQGNPTGHTSQALWVVSHLFNPRILVKLNNSFQSLFWKDFVRAISSRHFCWFEIQFSHSVCVYAIKRQSVFKMKSLRYFLPPHSLHFMRWPLQEEFQFISLNTYQKGSTGKFYSGREKSFYEYFWQR